MDTMLVSFECPLKDMVNSKRSNALVGKIIDKEKFILKYIKPWQKFLLSIEK